MLKPDTYEELATYLEREGRIVFLFTADWCPDCQFLYPFLDELEANNPSLTFVQVDRDDFMLLAQKWDIFGIPSLIVVENGREIGRLVNKRRKTKEEINRFLAGLE
ncbi:thioredoxin family protein [Streptococcus sobrinus]|nr:thioredoxin family protein [Streptococcus sobrinus]AWN19660.1 thioredoxin [Streptococcus sobrinus]AWN21602.1 thioredoxin [Streptococcus sobrinus]AWN62387.1 thioredoxin [Streptococcus sobrinus]AWN64262.1 thioredoxin [Streptococcus sobrinus]EMP70808.1 thioredoxin [Streptococcus sobrinus DSM 20742 = ATCC 33478]